jgi:hypothetical protein
MKKVGIIIVFFIVLGCTTAGLPKINDSQYYLRIVFASGISASEYLKTQDVFLLSLSPFDRSARMKTSREIDNTEFIDYISSQAMYWTTAEEEKINSILIPIRLAFSEYNLSFPEDIIFIKTTGLEEGNAAYCRGNNIIVLPSYIVNLPTERLSNIIVHEFFHIYSRNNIKIQELLYGILSFNKCKELQLPDIFSQYKITNPDASVNNYYFTLNVNGSDYKFMPILLASSDYNEEKGGEFFDYMGLYFIAIVENEDISIPLIENNKYVLCTLNEIPDYIRLVGRNTNYIIHPEEILADNFEFLINETKNLPNMEIIEEMKTILKGL